ncbi:Rho guanine nucleotide exchange factor 8 [Platanthera guangdongensis]|uniref:Rho guanine nucleotide exchange factor 8 n=1 Tax=Platanthera guangdongensis TaxID=2320717 RepID=A0ABR2N183_9ASPA
MVRFLTRRQSLENSSQEMFENPEREGRRSTIENAGVGRIEKAMFWSQGARIAQQMEGRRIGAELDQSENMDFKSRLGRDGACIHCGTTQNSLQCDTEQMKEKFAKLLLGEDMSGCGKGVSSALALSNAITNLAASVFGEQHKLEPMSAETKSRWRREIDWLLSVTDHMVDFVPSQQVAKDGTNMEIMTTRQRRDLLVNIPALRKLDAMLLGYLDNFKDQNEFCFVKKDADGSEENNAQRKDDKWWLPVAKVPANGLSEVSRKWLQFQKESINQVLKAAMAINAQVLMEMEIPEAYIESLPKNGRASLGDSLYRGITVEHFDPEVFVSSLDLSSEHKVLDMKNRIEASVIIWKRKMHNKDGKSWGSGVSLEKREQFEERAETILHLIKSRFPGIPQSGLDINKIQYNKDVGQSILESYSRVLETLAYTIMSTIEEVLRADRLAQDPGRKSSNGKIYLSDSEAAPLKKLDSREEIEKLESMEPPPLMTLSDFMGWETDQDTESGNKEAGGHEDIFFLDEMKLKKPPGAAAHKKFSYREKLEALGGLRSPTSRH